MKMAEKRASLTREQRERDYNYLWEVFRKCYPMEGAMKLLGYDWNKIEEECRGAVVDAEDDLAFCVGINEVFERLEHFAHTNLLSRAMFENYQSMFVKFAEGMWEGDHVEGLKPWIEIFRDPKSEEFYSAFDNSKNAGRGFFWKGEVPENGAPSVRKPAGPVKTMVFPGNVAYIAIPTVVMERIAPDRPILFDFYEKVKECEHLILDFRGNGGGATDYWGKLLVSPTLDKPLKEDVYILYDRNELNADFIDGGFMEFGDENVEHLPIAEMPKLPQLREEYLTQVSRCFHAVNVYKPDTEHHFTVKKKIWVLTDKRVYSSAEGFAKFCKSTGWATLVGGVTGGDGGGVTPFHAKLPESGLIIRFKGAHTLNGDGSSNPQLCTTPDILCDPEDALQVCLEAIAME